MNIRGFLLGLTFIISTIDTRLNGTQQIFKSCNAQRIFKGFGKAFSIGTPFALTAYHAKREIDDYKTDKNFLSIIHREATFGSCSPQVEQWINQQAVACGQKQVKVLRYNTSLASCYYIAHIDSIGLSYKIYRDLALTLHYWYLPQWVKKRLFGDRTYEYNRAVGYVYHELGHRAYGDNCHDTKLIALISAPIVIQILSSGLKTLCKLPPLPATMMSLPLHFTAGLGKYTIGSICAFIAYLLTRRHQETKADVFACKHINSPQILRDTAKSFESLLQQLPQEDRTRIGYTLFDPTHPYPPDRAKMLRDRADELERQQKADSINKKKSWFKRGK